MGLQDRINLVIKNDPLPESLKILLVEVSAYIQELENKVVIAWNIIGDRLPPDAKSTLQKSAKRIRELEMAGKQLIHDIEYPDSPEGIGSYFDSPGMVAMRAALRVGLTDKETRMDKMEQGK
jgi:hypothetical protein